TMPGGSKITIVDVARAAGVSVATVSAVINGRAREARISPETVQKVLAVIDDLEYQPHHLAQSLRRGSTQLIGLTVSSLHDPFYTQFCMTFGTICRANGYGMFLTDIVDWADTKPAAVAGARSSVDGVVTVDTRQSPWHAGGKVLNPSTSPIPTILVANQALLAHWNQPLTANTIVLQTEICGQLAARHLFQRGCRRFAYIPQATAPEMFPGHRELGFCDELAKLGVPADHVTLGPLRQSAYYSMNELIRDGWPGQGGRPAGVYVESDLGAMEVIRAVHEAGWRVPYDVAIIGTNGSPLGRMTLPPLTSVSLRVEWVAQEAARLLLELVGGITRSAQHPVLYVQPELVVRESA
ncbi:MAG: LacI family DNA-binding transcriptional regulator, partial [Bacteroidota bacterium]